VWLQFGVISNYDWDVTNAEFHTFVSENYQRSKVTSQTIHLRHRPTECYVLKRLFLKTVSSEIIIYYLHEKAVPLHAIKALGGGEEV
jgi:hypothetical protein